MNLYVVGINHRTAPLVVREKISLNAEEQESLLAELLEIPEITECVVLSTCNRTELYVSFAQSEWDNTVVEKALCRFKQVAVSEFKKYFYIYYGSNAVKHLFKVTAGIDSLIVGEDQILGQVKRAHQVAAVAGGCGALLNTLFREAVVTAKRIKNATRCPSRSRSVAAAAMHVIGERWPAGVSGKSALLIGSGAVSCLVVNQLLASGIATIWLSARNRTRTAEIAANDPRIQLLEYAGRYRRMNEVDLVFSMTASPHYTITREQLAVALTLEKERFFIDLAVPRDLDAEIAELPGVQYRNIDHLRESSNQSWENFNPGEDAVEQILAEQVAKFERWVAFRKVLPLLKQVQDETQDIVDGKVAQTLTQMQTASEREKEIVRAAMQNLAAHLLNDYIYNVRESVSGSDLGVYFKCLGQSRQRRMK